MKRQRLTIVAMAVALTCFFNIERLDVRSENLINLDSSVYLVAAIAVVLTLAVPAFSKANVLLIGSMWAAIYLIIKVYALDSRPIVGGIYTYLSITEVSFILVLVVLAHRLATVLWDFEDAVRAITMANAGRGVKTWEEASVDVKRALMLSRRHQRPLSVLVVEPDVDSAALRLNDAVLEVQRSMIQRYAVANLAGVIDRCIRRTDLAVEQRNSGRFVIICPETHPEGAMKVSQSINASAKKIGVPLACGTASFPGQALTLEELVRCAESNLSLKEPQQQKQVRDQMKPAV